MTREKTPKNVSPDGAYAATGTVSQGGREGGRLARDIGTQDELKRAAERPAGATRVNKSDEKKRGTSDG